jgi:hypothetical protein
MQIGRGEEKGKGRGGEEIMGRLGKQTNACSLI